MFDAAKLVTFGHAGFLVHDGEIQNDALETMFQFKAPDAGTAGGLAHDPAADSKLAGGLYAYDAKRRELIKNDADVERRVGQIFFRVERRTKDYFVKVGRALTPTIGLKYKLTFKHIEVSGSRAPSSNAQELRASQTLPALGMQTWGFKGVWKCTASV